MSTFFFLYTLLPLCLQELPYKYNGLFMPQAPNDRHIVSSTENIISEMRADIVCFVYEMLFDCAT